MAAGSQDRGKYVYHNSMLTPLMDKYKILIHYYFSVQVVKNNLNPIWKPFRISLRSLCGGDVEKPIKVFTLQVSDPL